MKLVSVAEMQEIERAADASGLSYAQMMENAGRGLAEVIQAVFSDQTAHRVLGLVGSGNNGGDTLVALAHLAQQGWQASAYLVRPRPENDPLVQRVLDAGGVTAGAEQDEDFQELMRLVAENDLLIDGVLGTGIRLPLKAEVAQPLQAVQEALDDLLEQGRSVPFIVAVDCPSGIDLDSGEAADEVLPADLTVTMAAVKQGLLRFPAYELGGELQVVGIGPIEELEEWKRVGRFVLEEGWVVGALPERPLDAHKGTFGTVLAAAGSINYSGAALLAGEAAYRIGAGLVTLAVPGPVHMALAGHLPEATWVLMPNDMGVISREAAAVLRKNLERVTCLLTGPGMGVEDTTRDFLANLLGAGKSSRRKSAIGFHGGGRQEDEQEEKPFELPPLVIDADGLKLLARIEGWAERLPDLTILTPHPGEMAVLTGLSKDEIQADRIGTAERFAQAWGHVVVLKGAFTVIASPDGRTAVVPVATPALARAGTGDVLAGLIAGLRAQGVAPFDAAAAGAWIHAQAGLAARDSAGGSASVLAGDVLRAVPEVLASLGVLQIGK